MILGIVEKSPLLCAACQGMTQSGSSSASASAAIGVLSAPSASARRAAARTTWLLDIAVRSGDLAVRFVLGGRSSPVPGCAEAAALEATLHKDVVVVDTSDCRIWHSAAKVHAWFKHALDAFPQAEWLGKSEDDTLPWPSAVLADLVQLSADVEYYGVMAWQGSCSMNGQVNTDCAGCFGGPLVNGQSVCRPAVCHGKLPRCCQVGCPRTVRMAPFAIGAIDLRRRRLARTVADCAYADRFFARVSAHGDQTGAMCSTTDGAQGHVLGECVRGNLVLADAGSARMADGTLCRRATGRCAQGSVAWLHPLKRHDTTSWNATWAALALQTAYAPLPIVQARVSALGPASRPQSRAPLLQHVRDYFGRAMVGNATVAATWVEREQYVNAALAPRARPGGRTSSAATSTSQSTARAPGARRRLRSETLWARNCSRHWT